jgi:type IV secretion system protein VirD4
MQVLQMVEGVSEPWIPRIEAMTMSRFDVRRVAAEMLAKQEDSPKEFGAIMSDV